MRNLSNHRAPYSQKTTASFHDWRFKIAQFSSHLAPITHLCYDVSTMLSTRQKTKIIKETGIHDKDTGSPEVQVAILTKRIDELTSHLRKHRKDNHSRRGLLGMVADRQTHLNYLKKNNPRRYSSIIKKLELKK
jgi:small subunit ribosomal protein S15